MGQALRKRFADPVLKAEIVAFLREHGDLATMEKFDVHDWLAWTRWKEQESVRIHSTVGGFSRSRMRTYFVFVKLSDRGSAHVQVLSSMRAPKGYVLVGQPVDGRNLGDAIVRCLQDANLWFRSDAERRSAADGRMLVTKSNLSLSAICR